MRDRISYALPHKISSSTDEGLIIEVVRWKSAGMREYYNRLAPDGVSEIGSDGPDVHLVGTITSGIVKPGDVKHNIDNATAAFDKLVNTGKDSIGSVFGQPWCVDKLQ
mmetsp:Transcript_15437/g.63007  ORF Transcript_15437/g.63007 Transcript_15437/m.63007 type:complete len:108 (-) Transcript_15437:1785-2108(-)